MFKKIVFVLFSATCTFSFAGSMGMVAGPSNSEIFFAGLTGGIDKIKGDYYATSNPVTFRPTTQFNDYSFLGGMVFGLEKTFPNRVYLALVGNTLYNSQSSNRIVNQTPLGINHLASLTSNFQFGAAIRIGADYENFTPYLLGGVEAGIWELGLSNYTNTIFRGIPAQQSISYKHTIVAPQAGVGTLYHFNPYWSVGLEYAHTWYRKTSIALIQPVIPTQWDHFINVDQNQLMASVNYRFNL